MGPYRTSGRPSQRRGREPDGGFVAVLLIALVLLIAAYMQRGVP